MPPSGETMPDTQMFWRHKNALEVLYHHSKFGGARISPAVGAAKSVEIFVYVCVSVMLLNNGVSAYDFAMNLLEYRNGFDTV